LSGNVSISRTGQKKSKIGGFEDAYEVQGVVIIAGEQKLLGSIVE
jgi:hypothetical protein